MRREIGDDAGFLAGAQACMPTVMGYLSIGFAAGGLGSLAGFSIAQVGLLAALLYAGSAQFLFYSLVGSGAGAIEIVLGVFLINARYVLMSSYMSNFFKGKSWLEKLSAGMLLTDETFGVASQRAKTTGTLPFGWLLGLNLTAYFNWILANLLGAALARGLPVLIADSLSFSLTAMFVGLLLLTFFASNMKGRELLAIAVACLIVCARVGTSNPDLILLIATIAGALASALVSHFKVRKELSWQRRSS